MVTPGGLVVLTDRRIAAGPLLPVVRAAVGGGASWVVLRERDLPYAERAALAESLREVVPPGRLIVAGPDPLGGDAVHLAAADPMPAGDVGLIGRSVHGAPALSGEDYVTLSPIWPTRTKPGYGPALGPARAAGLAGGVPWLALGGVDSADRAAECAAVGAAGVAVLGAVMRSADPERTAAELSEAFAAAVAAPDRTAAELSEASAAVDVVAVAAAPPRVGSLSGRAGKQPELSTGTADRRPGRPG
nr:thiamine phosphate synthase [Actinoplanes sp. M2I2]